MTEGVLAGSAVPARARALEPDLPKVSGHAAALDGLRVIAAIAVLLSHAGGATGFSFNGSPASWIVSRGAVGVPIFFALSGLLLYRPWARAALRGQDGPAAGRYLWRRALRILPAYWVVVIIAMLTLNGAHVTSWSTWTQYLFFAQIYNPHPWWGGTGADGLAQMWSLSVEVSFYLLLPLLAAALAWWAGRGGADPQAGRPGGDGEVGGRARRLLAGVTVFALAPFAVTAAEYYPHLHLWLGDTLPRLTTWFAVGMALAVVSEWAHAEHLDAGSGALPGQGPVARFCRTIAASTEACWVIAIVAFVLTCTPLGGPEGFAVPGVWSTELTLALDTIVALAVVAPVAFQPARPTWVNAALGNRVMRFLGKISYGIFLWQFLVIYAFFHLIHAQMAFGGVNYTWPTVLAILAFISVLTVAVSVLSYYALERPIRQLCRRSPSSRRTPPVAAAVPEAGTQ